MRQKISLCLYIIEVQGALFRILDNTFININLIKVLISNFIILLIYYPQYLDAVVCPLIFLTRFWRKKVLVWYIARPYGFICQVYNVYSMPNYLNYAFCFCSSLFYIHACTGEPL